MKGKKHKKNSKDKKTIEIIALVISGIALMISIASACYTVRKDVYDNKEIVVIEQAGIRYNETVQYDWLGAPRGQGRITGVNYSVTVSNNSKLRASIISDQVVRQMNGALVLSGNIVSSVKDAEGNDIIFPMSLDAGESILLTYELSTLIPNTVNALIAERYGYEADILYSDLVDYLGENGSDLYGNDVRCIEYADGTSYTLVDSPCYPVYRLQLKTAKGNIFEATLSH